MPTSNPHEPTHSAVDGDAVAPAAPPPVNPWLAESSGPVPHQWLGLTAILCATLMDLLDSTIINVAAPSIHRSLGGSTAELQWLAAAYTLALASGLLVGGRLGDMFGRRRMMLGACAVFTLVSVGCAFAWDTPSLIVGRALQGFFAALMVPQSFGLIREVFPGKDMAKAYAVFGPAIGLSTILGPVVAGLLINANVGGSGWRSIFLINVLFGGYTLLSGRIALPDSAPTARGARLDVTGALIGAVGMCLLIYPLIEGRDQGWPAWSFLMLVLSVPVFGLFALRQRALHRAGGTPLIELSVFKRRSYSFGLVFIMAFFGVVVGFSLSFGLFLQLGLGYTPLHASLVTTSAAGGAFLGSGFATAFGPKIGRPILTIGLGVMALGFVGLQFVFSHAGASISGWDMCAPLVVYGLGMGVIFVPLFDLILGDVGMHEVGSASSVLECCQQFGASLGVAVLGTIFFNAFGAHGVAAAIPAVHAAEVVVWCTVGLTAGAFLLVYLLPHKGQRASFAEGGAAQWSEADTSQWREGGGAGDWAAASDG